MLDCLLTKKRSEQKLVSTELPAINSSLSSATQTKYEQLREILSQSKNALVAFSGGVDSTLVAKVAFDVLGSELTLSVLAVSASLSAEELRDALALADEIGVRCLTIAT